MNRRTFLVILFIATLMVGSHIFADSENPTLTSPSQDMKIPEAKDYATQVLQDPWDMNNPEDINTELAASAQTKFKNISLKNGVWSGKLNKGSDKSGQFWLLFPGYSGSYATSKNGASNPIDTNTYNLLSFKMYFDIFRWQKAQDGYLGLTVYWFFSTDLKSKLLQDKVFVPIHNKKWGIYQIEVPKFAKKPIGLRIEAAMTKGNSTIKIDWARLTSNPEKIEIVPTFNQRSTDKAVFFDNDNQNYDGLPLKGFENWQRKWSTTNLKVDGLPPANYYFYLGEGEHPDYKYSNYSSKVIINKAPSVKIIEPDETGGADWARTVLKNPWDMKSTSDISQTSSISNMKFRKGIFSGLNGNNDPFFRLNLGGKAINAKRFHKLTFKYRYDGSFSLVRGTMSRIGWLTKNSPGYWQVSDDIVTYGGWNNITVDMNKIKLNVGNYGWKNWITALRFDLHEDPYKRRFYIADIALREDDRLVKSFAIKYKIDNDEPTTALKFYRDKDRTFGNGNEVLITQKKARTGTGAYRWKPSRKIKGLYWIYIQATDDQSTRGYYSSGPLKVH